ncbi:TRAP transporter substrate-binding protein DctP [Cupriavidus malaysiensis]|nr:TRAP transporter substrate-binding protein DctP [Cupriavidus malaysiensis]
MLRLAVCDVLLSRLLRRACGRPLPLVLALLSMTPFVPARAQPASAPAPAASAASAAASAPAPVTWRMTTEAPAAGMAGEGLSTFAEEMKARSGGTLLVAPAFEAGVDARPLPPPAATAARDARGDGGDIPAEALGQLDPLFQLPSLPFIATSLESARRLAGLARADYARALAAQGQHLLYITPWPPTGLWSRAPLASLADLRALTVRTADTISTGLIRTAGARAVELPLSDTMPRLREGSVNAVLCSGDDGAARKLWRYLPNFTAIGYAMPLSFTTVGNASYAALTPAQREVVDAAAQATEQRQWARLSTRIAENAAQMMANGVTVRGEAEPGVRAALRAAASAPVAAWRARTGRAAGAILDAFAASGGD